MTTEISLMSPLPLFFKVDEEHYNHRIGDLYTRVQSSRSWTTIFNKNFVCPVAFRLDAMWVSVFVVLEYECCIGHTVGG